MKGWCNCFRGSPKLHRPERGGAYLPLEAHPSFDRLAEDWIALLRCKTPTYDIIPYLVAMTGLNLILYQLERAREVLGRDSITLVWEIIGPKRSKVRKLSETSYQYNQVLPGQAVEHYIRSIALMPEWEVAQASEDPLVATAELLAQRFDWPDEEDMSDLRGAPQQLLDELVRKAQVRHRQHVGRFHGTWSRLIGLSSRRSSRSTRYAPTDHLLKTLVICRVDGRIEFKDFLASLYDRYGIIIGEHQAYELTDNGAADHEDFSENARQLEERLSSLGLLQRFSDSCAYVVNPFERVKA